MTGLIHIYCGDGKGKTTAAVGLAIRAAGAGKKVVFVQFLKDGSSSELKVLSNLENIEVLTCGIHYGFYKYMDDETRERACVDYSALFERIVRIANGNADHIPAEKDVQIANGNADHIPAEKDVKFANENVDHIPAEKDVKFANGKADLLVLDEILPACKYGIVSEERVLAFLKHKPEGLEIVLTGRGPSAALMETADYITEMRKIKHPFDQSVAAREGIEF